MKRGQIHLSFAMIFSIIVIIATVAVAFYVVNYFLKTSTGVSCKLFHRDLQDRITTAWNGEITQDTFSEAAPSGVSAVCIGSLNEGPLNSQDRDKYQAIKEYFHKGNFFFYPTDSECDSGNIVYNLDHIAATRFFCKDVEQGKISITLNKGLSDSLVTLS
ncbi:hypothetical protein KW805_04570 [Candidatus Pacearchaeota archaeon]|nr:hypothetical protein [Candidatus Pacearchaeota archaeon]